MEIEFRYVPYDATVWDVKRALGAVLHGDDFYDKSNPKERPINFQVELNYNPQGFSHNGSGIITLHDRRVAERLIKLANDSTSPSVVVKEKKLRLFRARRKPRQNLTDLLSKTPYLDPDLEEAREIILAKLDVGLHVDKVQFGIFYRRPEDPPAASRLFSTEYEISHANKSAGLLHFEYDSKVLRLQLGDPVTEELAYNIVIQFVNMRKLAVGFDFGNPFICFELMTPPVFQLERFNRTLTGVEWNDTRKYRQRLDSLNEAHKAVSPYAHQMRIILHDQRDLDKFRELCVVAGITRPIFAHVEAFSNNFFTSKKVYNLQCKLKEFSWPVAFQIEALVRNALVHTHDLYALLLTPIEELCQKYPQNASDTLRLFTEELRTRDNRTSIIDCWNKVRNKEPKPEAPTLRPGDFLCHHVTVTPTRFLLEGPYVIQSNRVIRDYEGYQDNFIRIDFRDEDHLQYRWERDTDGTTLLHDRVGTILKKGLQLGGRYFEFLAYSSSALREHAVWFVHPFHHVERGFINAERIRQSLGDFSNVIDHPSKYAARMAQAFTATDPSVGIRRDQWEEVADLGTKPYLHTDGTPLLIGGTDVKQGCKGMVAVDEQLPGIYMRVRESMNKFKGFTTDLASIEIARAFERPNTCYLNRPLIMVLEDRGVDKKVFITLQQEAIANIHMASDEIAKCRQLFREHSLGPAYRIAYILQCLKAIGIGMQYERSKYTLHDPFIDRLIHFAKNSVLRSIKHAARIPIPDSYLLVGVADEGPAYEAAGHKNVFKLNEAEIYACVQRPEDEEPQWIQGLVSISRSPVVHPGDVQRVTAIGKPPDDCERSLASMLGGGDLDGDMYAVIKEPTLLPTTHIEPAKYESVEPHKLGRDSTIEDICDFVVEYINSDVLGLLSDRHLMIADQSRDGTMDDKCIRLAALCSQAVDYPKNGVPVDIHEAPNRFIHYKPDWKKAEDNTPRETDYYESSRALGHLFRGVSLLNAPQPADYEKASGRLRPLSDSISKALKPFIVDHLGEGALHNSEEHIKEMEPVFRSYLDELRYMCLTHSLSDSPDSRLSEEEVVIGSILANCSQHRYRQDRMYRMRLHSSVVVNDTRRKLWVRTEASTVGGMRYGLGQAWLAWDFGMRNRAVFGANSFALIALGVILDILDFNGDINLKGKSTTAQAAEDHPGF
ncbi:hypothetical protein NM688_g6770 [Phlebia brevispora]|uniref:Uncharacterized protein n=1 Tax=Phlebia brevispora TaxID=194682 RepID=A0ACC1SCX1_9APHY|nr:hypothetical protein NM688_g6770 [Phlebia brevispora]